MINYILGFLIFSFSFYQIYKHIKNTTQGKCGACSQGSSCASSKCKVNYTLIKAKQV